MKTLNLNLPEKANEMAVLMAIAAILFNKGILSSGQAAYFAKISKREFLESVGKYGVSFFGESIESLKKDLS